jgi:hypothetical protein
MRGPTSPYGTLSSLWGASKAAYSNAIEPPYAYLVRPKGNSKRGLQRRSYRRAAPPRFGGRLDPQDSPARQRRRKHPGRSARVVKRPEYRNREARPRREISTAEPPGGTLLRSYYLLRPMKLSGSTCRPLRTTSKCTCGPVERPVEPISAIESPRFTVWPTKTSVRWQWA